MQLAVPLYSAYLAYSTFTGARQGLAGMMGGVQAQEADGRGSASGSGATSKRQQKMEKRGGQKVQYR